MTHAIAIAGRSIGPGHPPYVVAEMSGNHNGDINRAYALMEAAKKAGADAVKLQTYTADTITLDHDGEAFLIRDGLWAGRRLYELYQQAATPWAWHEALFAKGRELGLTVFSAPFDPTAVDFLHSLDAPAYKIASFEIVDLPLIEKAAGAGRPLVLSTGMASLGEIEAAVATAEAAGCREILLLHCVSGYPTPVGEADVRMVPHLAAAFGRSTGLSDHSLGTAVAVAAVALGACLVEKHFTLSRADGGPDAAFSLEPDELATLVRDCRAAWQALGQVRHGGRSSEAVSRTHRRSLYVVRDIAAGEPLTTDNVRSIRPGHGLPPKHLPDVLGRRAARTIARGTPLDWSLLN